MLSLLKPFLIATFFLLALSACETVLPASTPLPVGTPAIPPRAYNELCERAPAECMLPMTKGMQKMVSELHLKAKSIVIPTMEVGPVDYWQILSAPGPGDCEDFALTLRQYLREVLPGYAGAFRLATAFTETNQYHAILTIETTAGTVVCDIRFPQCDAWEQFPYEWHLREVVGSAMWQNISPVGQQLALENVVSISGDTDD